MWSARNLARIRSRLLSYRARARMAGTSRTALHLRELWPGNPDGRRRTKWAKLVERRAVNSFAEHYLSAYRAVMPSGRPPKSVVEMMPALHLLVMAVELVIKAGLMRSEKDAGNHHSLRRLYEALEDAHRQEADDRFARCEPNARLKLVGEPTSTVSDVLTVYDSSYGGASKVYMDTRYYAEPTPKFEKSTSLHGANLVKGNTPYPIFLPHVVESLIETFRFFDGAARLQRLGGQVTLGARAATKNNHGDCGVLCLARCSWSSYRLGKTPGWMPATKRYRSSGVGDSRDRRVFRRRGCMAEAAALLPSRRGHAARVGEDHRWHTLQDLARQRPGDALTRSVSAGRRA